MTPKATPSAGTLRPLSQSRVDTSFALLVLLLAGSSDRVQVAGRLYVVTKGRDVVKMPGAGVWACEESTLKAVAQECNERLASEFPKYQARIRGLELQAQAAKRRDAEMMEVQKRQTAAENEYKALEEQIQRLSPGKVDSSPFGTPGSDRKTRWNNCSYNTQDELAGQKGELADQFRAAITAFDSAKADYNSIRESSFSDSSEKTKAAYSYNSTSQAYNATYARYSILVRALESGKLEPAANTPSAWTREAELRLKKLALQREADSLTAQLDADFERMSDYSTSSDQVRTASLNIWSEWEHKKETTVALAMQLRLTGEAFKHLDAKGSDYDASACRFQQTRTDSEGVFRFTLPKSGAYCFVGTGARAIPGGEETYFWVKRSLLSKPGQYVLEINNEHEQRSADRQRFEAVGPSGVADTKTDGSYWVDLLAANFGLNDLSLKTTQRD